jgi:hypothetical protein
MGDFSDMTFWHLVVPPGGKQCTYEVEQTPTESQYVHVTNVALGPRPGNGPHTLTITVRCAGSAFAGRTEPMLQLV